MSIGQTMFKSLLFVILVLISSVAQANLIKKYEVRCIAKNMYWEARNQSLEGMIAVGYVTMNRVADQRFPNSACEVVHQAQHSKWWLETHGKWHPLKNRCQFSWYCDGKSDKIPPQDRDLYSQILGIAEKIYYGYDSFLVYDFTKGATHYHADYVYPDWAESKTQTVTIGKHIFYRWEK